jgi:predicted nucleotidyltransferase
MNQDKLISLAMNFSSFLVDRAKVDRIILYGSVATNSFDKGSDIDLFVEADKKFKKKVSSLLELYKKSKEYEKYKLDGVENEISIKCGRLDEWRDLKRSIISNGVVIYGKYEGKAEGLRHKILFMTELVGKSKAEKIKIWRKLYGYKQKVGKKIYVSEGLAERKIGRGAFISSLENSDKVKEFLRKKKVKYRLMDVWVE